MPLAAGKRRAAAPWDGPDPEWLGDHPRQRPPVRAFANGKLAAGEVIGKF